MCSEGNDDPQDLEPVHNLNQGLSRTSIIQQASQNAAYSPLIKAYVHFKVIQGELELTIVIRIDREECISCATCEDICPEVFGMSDDDWASVAKEYRKGDRSTGEIPDELEGCAQEAADACPVAIIHLD